MKELNMKNIKYAATALTLALAPLYSANAEVKINGFANLVAGVTSSQDTLYGYEDSFSFSQESLFALQITGDIASDITATAQIVARADEDYSASFEWAYLSYAASDNTQITLGRFGLPLFRYSASLDVGYTYHWVNAPQAVYNVPANNIDGLGIAYSNYTDDWEYTLQLSAGSINSDLGDGNSFEGKNVVVASAEIQNDWLLLRGVHGVAKSTFTIAQLGPLFESLDQAGLSGLSNDLALVEDTGTFTGFGVEVNVDNWFVSSEIIEMDFEQSAFPTDEAFYVTTGIRLGKFTPSITYERLKNDPDDIKFLDQITALPEPFMSQLIGFQSHFNGILIPLLQALDTTMN